MGEIREAYKITEISETESGSGFGSYLNYKNEYYILDETYADNFFKKLNKRKSSDYYVKKEKIDVLLKDNKIADISCLKYHELEESKEIKLKIANEEKQKALDKLTEHEKELLNLK